MVYLGPQSKSFAAAAMRNLAQKCQILATVPCTIAEGRIRESLTHFLSLQHHANMMVVRVKRTRRAKFTTP